ncbi:MAG: hypothetical protein J3K34DRAFT_486700, partial [Monoraphidium minutum]
MRALLHGAKLAAAAAAAAAADDDLSHHDDHDDHGGGGVSQSLMLRLVALAAILAAGLLGGLPPVLMRSFQGADALAGRLARAFGGGVIVTLALVHVLPDSIEMLGPLTPFPLAAVLAAARRARAAGAGLCRQPPAWRQSPSRRSSALRWPPP